MSAVCVAISSAWPNFRSTWNQCQRRISKTVTNPVGIDVFVKWKFMENFPWYRQPTANLANCKWWRISPQNRQWIITILLRKSSLARKQESTLDWMLMMMMMMMAMTGNWWTCADGTKSPSFSSSTHWVAATKHSKRKTTTANKLTPSLGGANPSNRSQHLQECDGINAYTHHLNNGCLWPAAFILKYMTKIGTWNKDTLPSGSFWRATFYQKLPLLSSQVNCLLLRGALIFQWVCNFSAINTYIYILDINIWQYAVTIQYHECTVWSLRLLQNLLENPDTWAVAQTQRALSWSSCQWIWRLAKRTAYRNPTAHQQSSSEHCSIDASINVASSSGLKFAETHKNLILWWVWTSHV